MARLRAYPRKRAIYPEHTLDYQLRDRRFDPPPDAVFTTDELPEEESDVPSDSD